MTRPTAKTYGLGDSYFPFDAELLAIPSPNRASPTTMPSVGSVDVMPERTCINTIPRLAISAFSALFVLMVANL